MKKLARAHELINEHLRRRGWLVKARLIALAEQEGVGITALDKAKRQMGLAFGQCGSRWIWWRPNRVPADFHPEDQPRSARGAAKV